VSVKTERLVKVK